MEQLKGKKIVLGITGSIAAYKAAVITRLLIKAGAEVQVVITPSGKEFITPVTLSALTGKPVISEFFTANSGSWNSHVDLGLWADALLIAPATAATIAKMVNGVADNMLITTYLSCKAPVFVAPAMDLDMFAHPSTQCNIALLQSYGNQIIEPAVGELASHLQGKGRMEEPEKIVEILNARFGQQESLSKKKILITAGPTYEKIDPVRFIGNYSSGKMGYALAEECVARGAEVVLVSGPVNLAVSHPRICRVNVESAMEMYEATMAHFDTVDAAFCTAAVADYRPGDYSEHKIKREDKTEFTLSLLANPDIAAALGARKKKGQIVAGFALESDAGIVQAQEKMRKKKFDFIVLNTLQDEGAGFKTDTNKITIVEQEGEKTSFTLKSKREVAVDIINCLVKYL